MHKTYKLALSGLLIALGVLTGSLFFIPIGVIKAFPIQHLINVLSAVLLGPLYAVANAFLISLFRNLIGSGSLLAFPGSMIGAALAGALFYVKPRRLFAFLGELVGTGVIGAAVAGFMAKTFLGSTAAFGVFFTSFFASSAIGALTGVLLYTAFDKTGVLDKVKVTHL